jgi:aquaporin Z
MRAPHWREYLCEAAGLGLFLFSACVFGTLLAHPASPLHRSIADPFFRRSLMGLAMGLTAVAIVYSPLGARSGAHLNPSVTLTFFRLGKVAPADAALYVVFQFLGGASGVGMASLLLGSALGHPEVRYVVTAPGRHGVAVAFAAEAAISFVLMTAVLWVSNVERIARLTGVCSAVLVATYIIFEAPLSGMSMNPARTVASALAAGHWRAVWIYFAAPLLGMLAAAELYVRLFGDDGIFCAKLDHRRDRPCIFCAYRNRAKPREPLRHPSAERGELGCQAAITTTSSSSAAAPEAGRSRTDSRRAASESSF